VKVGDDGPKIEVVNVKLSMPFVGLRAPPFLAFGVEAKILKNFSCIFGKVFHGARMRLKKEGSGVWKIIICCLCGVTTSYGCGGSDRGEKAVALLKQIQGETDRWKTILLFRSLFREIKGWSEAELDTWRKNHKDLFRDVRGKSALTAPGLTTPLDGDPESIKEMDAMYDSASEGLHVDDGDKGQRVLFMLRMIRDGRNEFVVGGFCGSLYHETEGYRETEGSPKTEGYSKDKWNTLRQEHADLFRAAQENLTHLFPEMDGLLDAELSKFKRKMGLYYPPQGLEDTLAFIFGRTK
jgi:hypothetical protein